MTRISHRLLILLLCAAMLTGCTAAANSGEGFLLREATLPEYPQYPEFENGWPVSEEEYEAWRSYSSTLPTVDTAAMKPFLTRSTELLLGGADGQNRVYSPINVYLALGMLAETTGNGSRQQVLELLGGDLNALRQNAEALWLKVYRMDGVVARELAASLWLDEGIGYKQDTLDRLCQHYFAAVYQGKMGDSAYNAALQAWLDEHTGGLLKEQTQQITMPPETLLSLATTVYYKARWDKSFSADSTSEQVFHAPGGDVERDFMHARFTNHAYYWAERFSAVHLTMNGGTMWILLPDEGVTVDDILADGSAMTFLLDADSRQCEYLNIDLALPKFDVSSRLQLSSALQKLGVTDVFRMDTADFTPLTDSPAVLSSVQHGARVRIDEEGCEGAAYTVMMLAGMARPPEKNVTFTVDRPFLFCITVGEGLPLFVGVVNNP